MRKNSQIGKDVLFASCPGAVKPKTGANNKKNSESSKSTKLQYFPCGTANCSVHHYTGQNKASSPHAVFSYTNPLYTDSRFQKRTDYRKGKSNIDFSSMPAKYTSPPNVGKGVNSKYFKQTKVTAKSDPEFKLIIRGKSLKLKPDRHTLQNCQNVKRCKICGEVMLGSMLGLKASVKKYSAGQLDEESCSDCKASEMSSNVDYTEKVERILSNSKKRQCIICSTSYYNFSGSKLCEKCVKVIKNQANDVNVTPSFEEHVLIDKDTFSSVKTNSESKINRVNFINTEDDLISRFTDCKISCDINTTSVTKQFKKQVNLTQRNCLSSDLDDKHPNNTNQYASTERPSHKNQTKLASKFTHEFRSTVIADPSLKYHNRRCSEDEITLSSTESPVHQNVSVNNYYFLKYCNKTEQSTSSASSSASSEQSLSESEDSFEIDKLDGGKKFSNCNRFGYQICHEKQRSSMSKGPSSQHGFPITFRRDSNHALINDADEFMHGMFQSTYGKVSLPEDVLLTLESDINSIPGDFKGKKNNFHHSIQRYETSFQDSNASPLSFKNELRSHNRKDNDRVSYTKTINPYIEKSLAIFKEMLSLRNEAIEPAEILEELKKNKTLMEAVNQMAAKKLNFHRNSAVFKNLPPK